MSEESIKNIGEDLARVAVESDMGAKQLQMIYRLAKTKPLAFIEAHIKRQIGRKDIRGKAGFKKALEVLEKFREHRSSFEKALMYAVMLYEYLKRKPAIDLESVADPIVKRVFRRKVLEYAGLSIDLSGINCRIDVKAKNFHGNPVHLSREIEQELRKDKRFSGLNLKIWIVK